MALLIVTHVGATAEPGGSVVTGRLLHVDVLLRHLIVGSLGHLVLIQVFGPKLHFGEEMGPIIPMNVSIYVKTYKPSPDELIYEVHSLGAWVALERFKDTLQPSEGIIRQPRRCVRVQLGRVVGAGGLEGC